MEKIINQVKKILNNISIAVRKSVVWLRDLTWKKKVVVLAVVGAAAYALFFIFGGASDVVEVVENKKQVTVKTVAELSGEGSTLNLVGVVESVSEATIRSDGSGQLTRVTKKVGDKVFAGEVLASLENSAERAAVVQAEGAYEQAKAAREISLVNLNNNNSKSTLETAKNNAVNAIAGAYVSMDDTVRAKTDSMFSNPRTQSIKLLILAPDQALTAKIETDRREIESILVKRESRNKIISVSSDLESEIDMAVLELQTFKTYFDNLSKILSAALSVNEFNQVQIDAQKAQVAGARQAINQSISRLNEVKQSLASAINLSQVTVSERDPSLASSDANVKIAQGAYLSALSRLNKTVIRSPITGTLNLFSVKTGDYVTPSQQLAVVSNNKALEVKVDISQKDTERVKVDQVVMVNNTIEGVITRVAEAIDPSSKKIEARIGFKTIPEELSNGDSVRISFDKEVIPQSNDIFVPIEAVKMKAGGAVVFVVVDGKLEEKEVKLGDIASDKIKINGGLTLNDSIVVDARSLKSGLSVEIKVTE